MVYCGEIAKKLNDSGQDMRKVLKPEIAIRWTKDSFYTHMWKPVQKVMYDTDSSKDLETKHVSEIYDTINLHTSTHHGVSSRFPSKEIEMLNELE